ncbi:MAG: hypothetical protein M0Z43_00315 [Acidithiobacillus sp.]|nr:hypothetical protein [Acidithiobacillus sp.]
MSNLIKLRALVEDKRLERGGGVQPESQVDAAKAIGCAQPSLRAFLKDGGGVDVATCLRLARYLELPRATVLRLAGHEDIANMLAEPETGHPDPALSQIARAIADLDDDQKTAVVTTVRSLSKTLAVTPRRKH